MQDKLKKTIFWFVLIQPFLDVYWLYKPPLDRIFKFSIPTILRIAGIVVILCLFLSIRQNWERIKTQWWLFAYLVILAAYCVAHLWSVNHFKTIDPTSYGYSNASEVFYLFRMFLPLVLLYVTQYAGISKKMFENAIKGVSGLFSGTIVLSNLFTVSLTSYHSFEAKRISANIFGWFGHHYYFSQLASKGFFFKGNTVSAILFMLLPLMLYFMSQHFNWLNVTLVVTQVLAMIMLGTKVGLYGVFAGLAVFLIIYVCHAWLQKDVKFDKKVLAAILILGAFTALIKPYSPASSRNQFVDSVVERRSKQGKETRLTKSLRKGLKKYHGKEERAFLKRFIRKHYVAFSLKSGFVKKSYSYKYDPYFWLHVMRMPAGERINYRRMEVLMLNKVLANNNQPRDKWLGISFIRENNIFPLERDFLAQVYSLGIIGMVLYLGFYVWTLLYAIVRWFKAGRQRSLLFTTLLVSTGFIMVTAFYSGNVLDYLTASLLIAFIEGYLLSVVRETKDKKSSLNFRQ